MQLLTGYLPIIVGLALLHAQVTTALPFDTTPNVAKPNAPSFNLTITSYGHHSPSKRSIEAIPYPCDFGQPRLEYYYAVYTPDELTIGNAACFAWIPTAACSQPDAADWTGSTTADFQNAVGQQVAKDGFFQSSSVGAWLASWQTGTTAFANRDSAELFNLAFLAANGALGPVQYPGNIAGASGAGEYLFAFNNDQMQVDRKVGTFGFGCL